MTNEEIRELIAMVNESGIGELEVQRGENRVRIRRNLPAETGMPAPVAAAPDSNTIPAPAQAVTAAAAESTELLIKSPIVGTFYECPSPGAPPFVQVGETVQPGKVLCIIESMKLMNEIEAEVAGVIEGKLVPNGQPVEYGEALFAIRPL